MQNALKEDKSMINWRIFTFCMTKRQDLPYTARRASVEENETASQGHQKGKAHLQTKERKTAFLSNFHLPNDCDVV